MIAPRAVLGLRNRFRYPFPGSPSVFKTDRDSFAIPHKAIENGSHRRDRILMTREEGRVSLAELFTGVSSAQRPARFQQSHATRLGESRLTPASATVYDFR